MRFTDLQKRYRQCRVCGLFATRRKVVIGTPADSGCMLFVGEGPGKAEDILGAPFVGPSGRLLRKAIWEAAKLVGDSRESDLSIMPIPIALTNIVACRPCDSILKPNRPPTRTEAWACARRLEQFMSLVSPRIVVPLGEVAAYYLRRFQIPRTTKLVHPAAILRGGGAGSRLYLGFVRDLSNLILQWKDK